MTPRPLRLEDLPIPSETIAQMARNMRANSPFLEALNWIEQGARAYPPMSPFLSDRVMPRRLPEQEPFNFARHFDDPFDVPFTLNYNRDDYTIGRGVIHYGEPTVTYTTNETPPTRQEMKHNKSYQSWPYELQLKAARLFGLGSPLATVAESIGKTYADLKVFVFTILLAQTGPFMLHTDNDLREKIRRDLNTENQEKAKITRERRLLAPTNNINMVVDEFEVMDPRILEVLSDEIIADRG